ncbi:hypothetical protein L6R29_09450 [Myxococcota bacterium]|nr:hypothetical protein [Myxococcota bacterium]
MAKVKKMRAHQMAEQLSMPFKEFRQYAQQQGYKLYSVQESLPLEEARALIAAVQKSLASDAQMPDLIASTNSATTENTPETAASVAHSHTDPEMLVVEAAQPPVVEAVPSPVVEAVPSPVVEAVPSPVVETAQPPVVEAAQSPVVETAAIEASSADQGLAVAETMSGTYAAWAQIVQLTSNHTETAKDSGTNPAFYLAEMIETGGESGEVARWPSDSMEVSVLKAESSAALVQIERVQQTTLLRVVTFQFEHTQTRPGDRLFVVGDRPEMGKWDPAQGVELDPSAWPMWKASILLPEGTRFSYKLVQKTAQGWVWELGADRHGVCEEGAIGILEGVFRR